MDALPIRNNSGETLRVMLEPLAEIYDVPPGGKIVIRQVSSDGSDGFVVDYWPENFLAVWVPGEVVVEADGVVVPPVLNT